MNLNKIIHFIALTLALFILQCNEAAKERPLLSKNAPKARRLLAESTLIPIRVGEWMAQKWKKSETKSETESEEKPISYDYKVWKEMTHSFIIDILYNQPRALPLDFVPPSAFQQIRTFKHLTLNFDVRPGGSIILRRVLNIENERFPHPIRREHIWDITIKTRPKFKVGVTKDGKIIIDDNELFKSAEFEIGEKDDVKLIRLGSYD